MVFRKLMADPSVVEGKRVVLVDDSVIRGNTIKGLIDDLRAAGALEIHVRSASPRFISECHYGVGISSKAELIATGRTNEEIAEAIGADSLEYLELPWLKQVLGNAACYGCMTGVYPTELRKPFVAELAVG
jgi:amidophosphoribosyltransferase